MTRAYRILLCLTFCLEHKVASSAEREGLLGCATSHAIGRGDGTKAELVTVRAGSKACVFVLVFITEVLLDDCDGLGVYFGVFVLLKFLNFVKTTTFLNDIAHRVFSISGHLFANFQTVLKCLHHHKHNLGVVTGQKITESLATALLHYIIDLFGVAAAGDVADSPGSFLLDVEDIRLENAKQRGDDIVLEGDLNLFLCSGRDVGESPAGFFANILSGAGEEVDEGDQGAGLKDSLGLGVVTCDNVAQGTKGGSDDLDLLRSQELNQTRDATSGADGLDLIVGFVGVIRDVRESPACISVYFVVVAIDESAEQRQSLKNMVKVGLGFASTEVAQSPSGITEKRGLVMGILEQLDEKGHGARVEHEVAAFGRVTSNITKGPHGLLGNVAI